MKAQLRYSYDFDMFAVVPEDVRQEIQGFFNELGLGAAPSRQVALWRDPRVVEALRNADEPVRKLFTDAGFGLNVYHSGAHAGRYPARDEAARNACIIKLSEVLKASKDLKNSNWGGFEVTEFLKTLAAARPIDEIEIEAFASAQAAKRKRRSRMKVIFAAGAALLAIPALTQVF